MMQWQLLVALRIFLILSFLQRVCRGIDCYQCKSNVDPNCSTKSADRKYLHPCPQTHGYCRKSDLIYYFTDSLEFITVRECAVRKTDGKECYRGRYSRDSYQRVCECRGTGCNRATNSVAEISRIVIVFLVLAQYLLT